MPDDLIVNQILKELHEIPVDQLWAHTELIDQLEQRANAVPGLDGEISKIYVTKYRRLAKCMGLSLNELIEVIQTVTMATMDRIAAAIVAEAKRMVEEHEASKSSRQDSNTNG